MLDTMLSFNIQILSHLATWLMTEPIVYFTGMVLMLFVVAVVINIVRVSRA